MYPKNMFYGRKITIAEFEISPLEYPLVFRFILNRVVYSFGAKFAPKGILGREFTKTIAKFEISAF